MSATAAQAAPRDSAMQTTLDNVLSILSLTLPERTHSHAGEQGLRYAGGLTPVKVWVLVSRGDAVLADVHTAEKRRFAGRVPNTPHATWQTRPAMVENPRFLRELEKATPKGAVVSLLCCSGKHSTAAAEAVAAARFRNVFSMLEGFEGNLDKQQQYGEASG